MTYNHLADLARAAAAKTTMTWEEVAVRVEAALEGGKASKILEEYAHKLGKDELTDTEKREALLLAVLRPS
jgi:hypothetical protein